MHHSITKGSGEHFSSLGRAAGNGEARQRARKGMRLVGYEPKARTPKPWTSCTTSLESSSQKQGYRHVLAKHARPGNLHSLLDFNQRSYIDGIDWTSKAGKTYPSLYSGRRLCDGIWSQQYLSERLCRNSFDGFCLQQYLSERCCPNFYDGFWLQKYLMIASKWNW